jgi:hypothetical protein
VEYAEGLKQQIIDRHKPRPPSETPAQPSPPGPPPGGHPSWDSYTKAVDRKSREGLADTPPPSPVQPAQPPLSGPLPTRKQRSRVVQPPPRKKGKKGDKRLPTGSPIAVDQTLPERPAPVEERPEESRNDQEPAQTGSTLLCPTSLIGLHWVPNGVHWSPIGVIG